MRGFCVGCVEGCAPCRLGIRLLFNALVVRGMLKLGFEGFILVMLLFCCCVY